MDKKTETALKRYTKDVELYHKEIEDLKKRIREEADECTKRHLSRMLLETQRALASVLSKMTEIDEQQKESVQ